MSASSQRVGKSLLKFFKPVKLTKPVKQDPHSSKDFQKQNLKTEQAKPEAAACGLEANESNEILAPPQSNANWVEMINYILAVCKKASIKFSHRVASPACKEALNAKAAGKIKFIGSIVNTNMDEAEETFFLRRLEKEAELEKMREHRRLMEELEEREREAKRKKEKKKDKSAA